MAEVNATFDILFHNSTANFVYMTCSGVYAESKCDNSNMKVSPSSSYMWAEFEAPQFFIYWYWIDGCVECHCRDVMNSIAFCQQESQYACQILLTTVIVPSIWKITLYFHFLQTLRWKAFSFNFHFTSHENCLFLYMFRQRSDKLTFVRIQNPGQASIH